MTELIVYPDQSIQTMIDVAGPGDVISIMPGAYFENLEIKVGRNSKLANLTRENRLTIQASAPGVYLYTADPNKGKSIIEAFAISHVTLTGLDIISDNSKAAANDGGGLKLIGRTNGASPDVQESEDFVLDKCSIGGTGISGIKCAMFKGLDVRWCYFDGVFSHTFIDLVTVWNSGIYRCTFDGQWSASIGMKAGSRDIDILRNNFYSQPEGEGQTSILVGGIGFSRDDRDPLPDNFTGFEAKDITVIENIIESNTKNGVMFQGGQFSVVTQNYFNNTGGTMVKFAHAASTIPSDSTDNWVGDNWVGSNITVHASLAAGQERNEVVGTVPGTESDVFSLWDKTKEPAPEPVDEYQSQLDDLFLRVGYLEDKLRSLHEALG